MKSKRGSIQSYGSIANVEGYEPIPDGSDYEEDEDLNGNCKLKTLKCHLETASSLNLHYAMEIGIYYRCSLRK